MRALPLIALGLASGCIAGSQQPPADFDVDAELTERGGCGDATVFANAPGGGVSMFIEIPELSARAWAAETPELETFEMPAEGISTSLRFGTNIGQLVCNDAIDGDYGVAWTLEAIEGTITGIVAPADAEPYGTATVELIDVVFHGDAKVDLAVPSMTIEAQIGGMPG